MTVFELDAQVQRAQYNHVYDRVAEGALSRHCRSTLIPLLVAAKKAVTTLDMIGFAPSLELRNAIEAAEEVKI